jgi:hypothetical protein
MTQSPSQPSLLPADPLAGLRDWHLPDPVSWWPPAPGWWLLLLLLIAGVAAYRLWRVLRARALAPTRLALVELEVLRGRLADGLGPREFVAALSQLLKRLALVRYRRDEVAGLSGADWLAFLDRSAGTTAFTQGAGSLLADSQFRASAPRDGELAALADLAREWIRAQAPGRRRAVEGRGP